MNSRKLAKEKVERRNYGGQRLSLQSRSGLNLSCCGSPATTGLIFMQFRFSCTFKQLSSLFEEAVSLSSPTDQNHERKLFCNIIF